MKKITLIAVVVVLVITYWLCLPPSSTVNEDTNSSNSVNSSKSTTSKLENRDVLKLSNRGKTSKEILQENNERTNLLKNKLEELWQELEKSVPVVEQARDVKDSYKKSWHRRNDYQQQQRALSMWLSKDPANKDFLQSYRKFSYTDGYYFLTKDPEWETLVKEGLAVHLRRFETDDVYRESTEKKWRKGSNHFTRNMPPSDVIKSIQNRSIEEDLGISNSTVEKIPEEIREFIDQTIMLDALETISALIIEKYQTQEILNLRKEIYQLTKDSFEIANKE